MADPATQTTYPLAMDELPAIGPLDKQNAPGLEHDEMHNRANAILNALQALVGLESDSVEASTILGRLLRAEGRGQAVEVNEQSGASYTLVADDAFKMVCMTNGAANAIVVPLNIDVTFPLGTRIDLSWDGVGRPTVTRSDPAIVINSPETLSIRKRYGKATLIKRGDDEWDLEGNLEPSP